MKDQEKSLLIAKLNQPMQLKELESLQGYLNNQLEKMGISVLVVDSSVEPQLHQPISALVDVIKAQTEAINNLVGSNIAILDELVAQNSQLEEEQEQPNSPRSLDDYEVESESM
ncbi:MULTISPECIES: hypothetical protein [unclassified Vibrio]|uniref:hypothetical protein n=1 Tax=unclassified Vibrio TaxID=2614977 RepID=UPI0013FB244E|nr:MULTISPECIES: hypothetical protein [unclassified Vibrio]NAX17193.1 hypothetical protein [Vibrio sp. V22_P2S10T140]